MVNGLNYILLIYNTDNSKQYINSYVNENILMLCHAGGAIDPDKSLCFDAEESDNEEAQEDDVKAKQQLAEQEPEEDDSFEKLLKFLAEKFPILKTHEGRAGLVHNFLRGLQLPSAPVPSGKKLSLGHDQLASRINP